MALAKTALRAHFYSTYLKGRKAWDTQGASAVNPYLDQRGGFFNSLPSFSSHYRRYWKEGFSDARDRKPDRYAECNGASDKIAKKSAGSKATAPVRMTVVARGVVSNGSAMVTVPEWDANRTVFVALRDLPPLIVQALSTRGGRVTALGNKRAREVRLLRLTDFQVL